MSSVALKTSNPTPSPGTVGRGKAVTLDTKPACTHWTDGQASLYLGDSLSHYAQWEPPTVIVSDGAYGILGFEGDTSDHLGIADWYEPHIQAWSQQASAQTTLWFWNSEIGWASVHPVLERRGWRYVNANVWNKGKAHIAGNVNTAKIRRFPVVTEMCVQYVFEARIDKLTLQQWLYREWKRTGLPMRKANEACEVKDVATRKYLDQGHLWYPPPPETFAKMAVYANQHGDPAGCPACNGVNPMMSRRKISHTTQQILPPDGFHQRMGTQSPQRRGTHPRTRNQRQSRPPQPKTADLLGMIISASSDAGDVVWEPSAACSRPHWRQNAPDAKPLAEKSIDLLPAWSERFRPRQPTLF
ncbi:MAG: hypothetical protein R3E93_07330 [Thiothrix sp.]